MIPHPIIALARRSLPLMRPQRRALAEHLIASFERTHNAAGDPVTVWAPRASAAFERDLQLVRLAVEAALRAGTDEALRNLRQLLPHLLAIVNQAPSLAAALLRAGIAQIDHDSAAAGVRTANAAEIDRAGLETEAMQRWRGRRIFETDLGSADLRTLSRELLNRSIFSARVTNAEFLQEIADVVDDMLSGKINQATGRLRLLAKLAELGYDPEIGFPGDLADVPPAERGSLQDLSSEQRLDLILETNMRMAAAVARTTAGNEPYALQAFPAWELVRLYLRAVPRGWKTKQGQLVEDEGNSWPTRWLAAANDVGWEGVSRPASARGRMVALKGSPVWQALGDGAGGFNDTLGNPFEPFAFRSGMGRRAVPQAELAVLDRATAAEAPRPERATLTPGQEEVQRVFKKLSPELQAQLRKDLGLA